MKIIVKVPGTRNYFNVFVEENKEKMIDSKKKFKGLEKDDEKAGAFFCPFEKFSVSKKTGEQLRAPLIGHIYFSKDNLAAPVIAREFVHASIYADRLLFGNKRAMFGMKISDKEERMTNNFSNMFDSAATQINATGV